MAPASAQPPSRALNAILPLIASGQAYEAHQKARTFASRYQKSNQYDTAIDVLFQSARELLKAGQQGSGTDLTCFMLDVYEGKGEQVSNDSRGRVTQLIALTGSSGSWRKTVVDKAIAWSAKHGRCPAGDPDLHHYIGELLYREGVFESAEVHFLASGKRDSARLLAQMFIEWNTNGGAPGAFALRGTMPGNMTLQADRNDSYLQNGNILATRTFLSHFIALLTSARPNLVSPQQPAPIPIGNTGVHEDEIIFTTDPALNFTQLAVRTCQRAQGAHNKVMREAWVRLCGTYQSRGGIMASTDVRKVLIELAELYFAIPPPRTQAANPLGDMLSAMFGGAPANAGATRRVLSPPPANGSPGLD